MDCVWFIRTIFNLCLILVGNKDIHQSTQLCEYCHSIRVHEVSYDVLIYVVYLLTC